MCVWACVCVVNLSETCHGSSRHSMDRVVLYTHSMPVTGDLVNSIVQRWISTWGQMQGTAQVQGPHSLLNSRFLPSWREECAAGLRLNGVGWGTFSQWTALPMVTLQITPSAFLVWDTNSFTFIFNYRQLKVSWEMQNPFAYNRSLLQLWEMIAIKFSCYYCKYSKYTHVLKNNSDLWDFWADLMSSLLFIHLCTLDSQKLIISCNKECISGDRLKYNSRCD